jgi:hypothetical protein
MATQTQKLLVVAAAALALTIGCGTGQDEPEVVEPGATRTTAQGELPGDHAADDLNPVTAQRWVDHVRMGRGLDADGKVPDDMATDEFASHDPIWVSMEVTDAPVGSKIRLTVQDPDTNKTVWTAEKAVEPGASHLGFSIDDLAPGTYLAQVVIGDERVADRRFQVV